MAEAATTPPETASVDPVSAITELLTSEQEATDEVKTEAQEETSSESLTENEKEEEQEAESEVEVDESEDLSKESDEDVTWEGVLGLEKDQLILDEDGEFKGVRVKVDGDVSEVGLKDLVAGFQTNKYNTQKSQTLSKERKEFESRVEQFGNEYKSKVENVEKLTGYLHQQLMKDFENVDWQRLRVESPGEYAAAMQDYNIRQQEIQTIANAISSEKKELTEKEEKEAKEVKDAYLKEQAEILKQNNPTWLDPKVAQKAFEEMHDFTSEVYGFTSEEFAQAYDARVIAMIQDAMAYRKSKKTIETKIKTPVPKFRKSMGRGGKRKPSKLDKLTKAAKSAKGSNKRRAQTEAITELLIGDK